MDAAALGVRWWSCKHLRPSVAVGSNRIVWVHVATGGRPSDRGHLAHWDRTSSDAGGGHGASSSGSVVSGAICAAH
eukprot:SAG31_NODE_27646_length_422_cov_1.377709_1_plen_75_part_10